MGHTIGLSPDKKILNFGVFKYNPERTDDHFKEETTIEMSKKETKALIKDLKDWERVMEE